MVNSEKWKGLVSLSVSSRLLQFRHYEEGYAPLFLKCVEVVVIFSLHFFLFYDST